MKRYLFQALIALGFLDPASAQTTIFNCSSFSSSGACGVSVSGGAAKFLMPGNGPPSLSGSQVLLMPTGATHQADALNWSVSPVNVQAFTSHFTFVPNGQNLAFVLQNNTNIYAGPEGAAFSAGAGCEAGFFQAFDANNTPPTNIFALELDSYSPLTENGSFTYSSAQIYQSGQSPCLPNDNGPNYYPTNKLSTSPVDLTTGSHNTTTGDTYSATVTYDGTTLTLTMYDVTKGGSCPGASCFTHAWNVNIPTWVGGTTAYVGITAATGIVSSYPLSIGSFSYIVESPSEVILHTPSLQSGGSQLRMLNNKLVVGQIGQFTLEVFNLEGCRVLKENGAGNTAVNISTLAKGAYSAMLTSGAGKSIQRIFVE